MDFEKDNGDMLLFDEVDEFMFNDTLKFINMTKNNTCICLTATSHDQD